MGRLSIRLLHESLLDALQNHPEKAALVAGKEELTYREFFNKATSLSDYLNSNGLKCGDRVGIYMDNTWQCCVSIYAVLMSGGVFHIINPQTKHDKLKYILNDSEAKFLITDAHLSKQFVPIVDDLMFLSQIICSGDFSEKTKHISKMISFDSTLKNSNGSHKGVNNIPVNLAALIYTSGTTGDPKGVMMTHQAMVFATESICEYLRLTDVEKILCAIPLAFDYGLYQLLMSVRIGATLILERSFVFPAQVLKSMKKNKATTFPGVPTIFKTLISMNERKKISFPFIKRITNTAAALSPELIPQLKEIFPNALIFKMYGITECKRISYLEPEMINEKISSVGKAIPGTEMFLLSSDGKPVPLGEIGVLYVRGPHIMQGYWKKDELSKGILKKGQIPNDRILCTQDLFVQDTEGYFYFKARSDDIIKTRGEKVSPVEVENVLYSIKSIKEAAVIGVEDVLLGETIKAFVVIEDGYELSDREIKKVCSSMLENFMVPKEIVFVDALPKTASGKISKKGLI
jgi:long-chain acyl-CoA synthetase